MGLFCKEEIAPCGRKVAHSWAGGARSQAAMEYLMTYGWSILLIAIVLGVLFILGVFSSVGGAGICISQPGFLCGSPKVSSNLGDACGCTLLSAGACTGSTSVGYPSVNVILGAIGGPYSNVYFAAVPTTQQLTDPSWANRGNPNDFNYWEAVYGQGVYTPNFYSGQQANIDICMGATLLPAGSVGKAVQTNIWMMYSSSSVSNALVDVGEVSAPASR